MKIVFFGSSEFAVPSLRNLVHSHHDIVAVVTQPDRPKGRHLHLIATPVKRVASELNLMVLQPECCGAEEFLQQMQELDADLFVVIAYGQLLPGSVLTCPRLFCVNLHASLLPKYRGAAPINWAIMRGEMQTGVTIFKLNPIFDQGDMISSTTVPIEYTDNALDIIQRLSHVGADLVVSTLNEIEKGNYMLTPQMPVSDCPYARKLRKTDGIINWDCGVEIIYNQIRALVPWPSAYTYYKKKILKILKAEAASDFYEGKPGEIVEVVKHQGFIVMCQDKALLIKAVQLEGSKSMDAWSFLLGHQIGVGDILGK